MGSSAPVHWLGWRSSLQGTRHQWWLSAGVGGAGKAKRQRSSAWGGARHRRPNEARHAPAAARLGGTHLPVALSAFDLTGLGARAPHCRRASTSTVRWRTPKDASVGGLVIFGWGAAAMRGLAGVARLASAAAASQVRTKLRRSTRGRRCKPLLQRPALSRAPSRLLAVNTIMPSTVAARPPSSTAAHSTAPLLARLAALTPPTRGRLSCPAADHHRQSGWIYNDALP